VLYDLANSKLVVFWYFCYVKHAPRFLVCLRASREAGRSPSRLQPIQGEPTPQLVMSSPERDVDMLPPHMLDAKAEAAIADTLHVNVTAWDGTVHPARTTNLARRPRTQSSSHSQEATHGEEHTMRVASWRADGAATEVAIAIDEARKAPRTSTSSRNNPPLLPGTPGSRADSSSGVRSVLTLSSETHSEQRSSEPLTQSGQGRAKRRGLSRSAAAASFIVNKFEASSYVRIEHSRLDESLVSFSLKQFCEQALVQVFIPFGSLYTWWYHGSAALRCVASSRTCGAPQTLDLTLFALFV